MREYLERLTQALGWEARDPYVHRYIVTLVECGARPRSYLLDEAPEEPGDRGDPEENEEGQEQDDHWQQFELAEILSVENDIDPSMLIAGDTPLQELLKLFTAPEPRVYLVLTGHEISHVVTPLELASTPVRMAFFAKILQLGDAIQVVLMRDAEMHVERLRLREPDHHRGRCGRAKKHGDSKPTPYGVIRSASLTTKWRMLTQDSAFATAVPNVAPHQAAEFLDPIVNVRNAIARGHAIQISDHAVWEKREDIGLLRRSDLYGLFLTLTSVTDALRRYLESK